jgi:hypothetical protein
MKDKFGKLMGEIAEAHIDLAILSVKDDLTYRDLLELSRRIADVSYDLTRCAIEMEKKP